MAEPAPPLTPVTTPVPEPIVAVASGLMLQVPPVESVLSVVVWPTHVVAVPVIGSGTGFTVMMRVLKQPAPAVYVTSVVPALVPVTIPVVTPIVAIEPEIVQVPPAGVQFIVVVLPAHTLAAPVISPGNAFTVTTIVLRQPVGSV